MSSAKRKLYTKPLKNKYYKRLKRPTVTIRSILEIICVYYKNTKDEKKVSLIEKYKNNVSKELIDEMYRLKAQAKIDYQAMFKELIYNKNPFLSSIKIDGT